MVNHNSHISLVADGRPRFCIEVRPSQDAEAMLGVLDELVLHLERCLEGKVAWFERQSQDAWPVRLVVHLAPEADFERQEFEIAAGQGEIVLRAATLDALHNAVYTFLAEAFGVRWLWPGETGTVTPRATEVSWPIGIKRHGPDWLWRRLWTGGSFWTEDDAVLAELKRGVSAHTLKDLHLWQRRNRLGGLNISDGHRWGQICSPLVYWESHPEYFGLVKGKRDATYFNGKHQNQPCTSNPEVVQLTVDYIIAQFRARPELDGFSFAVNDGGGFCECEACLAQDVASAQDVEDDAFADVVNEAAPGCEPEDHSITDRMFTFANRVAEGVAAVVPEKLLLFLVYGPYRTPPEKARLHPNVIAQFCAMSWSHVNRDLAERDHQVFRKLKDHANLLGIYEYFVNGKNGSMPRGFSRTFHRSCKAWHEMGGRYFASQSGLDFATNGLAYFTAARNLWSVDESFDTILDDYCQSGFGSAAEQVKAYLTAFLDRWEGPEGGCTISAGEVCLQAPRIYPEQWRRDRRTELDAALKAEGLDASQVARLQFLTEGLNYLDLLCEAGAAVAKLVDMGAPPMWETTAEDRAKWAQLTENHSAIKTALERRDELVTWMTDHRDGFYFSIMWGEYQRLMQGGLLGQWLDEFQVPEPHPSEHTEDALA